MQIANATLKDGFNGETVEARLDVVYSEVRAILPNCSWFVLCNAGNTHRETLRMIGNHGKVIAYTPIEPNNPARAGCLASRPFNHGPFGRYRIAAVHTRFDAVEWFVWDAETPDEDGYATVVRQEPTKEAALASLTG